MEKKLSKMEKSFPCLKKIDSFWNSIPTCNICNEYSTCAHDIKSFQRGEKTNKTYKYVFIFCDSAYKTSIQFNELISLIRKFSHNDVTISLGKYSPENLEILMDYDYHRADIIKFKHSCIVKTNYEINLRDIIYYSGYISFCGYLVHCDNWNNVNSESLIHQLKKYIDEISKKIGVIFYNDVDNENIKCKIKDILIDKERSYLGTHFLFKEIDTIKKALQGHITDKGYVNGSAEDILIIKDEYKNVTNEYHLYEDQDTLNIMLAFHVVYKKEDPLHLLDKQSEAKPYWAGIYTTPHNLTNAMFNLAQLERGNIILDPFLHTGTTILEAAKYDCAIIGSDIYEPIGAKDNITLLLDKDILKKCINSIKGKLKDTDFINSILSIVSNEIKESKENAFCDIDPVEKLRERYRILDQIDNRVIFYIVRRFVLRQLQKTRIPFNYLSYLRNQINLLEDYLHLLEYCNGKNEWAPNSNNILGNNLIDGLDKYTFKRITPSKHKNFKYLVIQCDAKRLSVKDDSIDAIITDPPYGYGDDIKPDELEELYICFIKEAFRVLTNNGKLVMCALDKVKTGKPIHPNTSSWGVINLIDKIAKEKGILFVKKDLLPITGPWFIDYWKSEHALNRVIINLQIIKSVPNIGRNCD